MAESIVDKFLISIGLDTKEVDKGLTDLTSKLGSGLKALATSAIAPALGALASGAFIQSIVDEIGVVNELSKTLDMSVESLGAWKNALIETGADATKTGDIFRQLNQGMIDGATRGRGILFKYVEDGLLPSFQDTNGALKNTQDYLLEISDVVKGMDTRTATGILKNVAGITDTDTVEFLQQGSAMLRANLAEAKRLGTFTKEDIKLGKDYDASVKAVTHSLKMLLLPVFRMLAPAMLAFSNGIREVLKHSEALYPALLLVAGVLGKAIVPLMWQAMKAAFAFMMTPTGALVSGLVFIGLLLEDFITWLDGGESAFGDFYSAIFNGLDNAQAMFKSVNDWIGNIVGSFDTASLAIAVAVGVVGTAIAGIIAVIGWIPIAVGLAVTAFTAGALYLYTHWDNVVNKMRGIWNGLMGSIRSAFDWIAGKFQWFTNGIEKIKSILPSINGAGIAVPASASNNVTNSRNTNVEQKVNVTIQGNADKQAIEQAQNPNGWNAWVANTAPAYD